MSPPPPARRLIVNADDVGRSAGVNRGVQRTIDEGIVTSVSLMVRWPAAAEAATWLRERPQVSVGLHLDLGEWRHGPDGWHLEDEVVDPSDARAVRAELARQLTRFEELLQRPPTHLDSHQHVHRSEPVRSVVVAEGTRRGVPVRGTGRVRYCGAFHGQTGTGAPLPGNLTADALVRLVRELPAGTTELGCHPGLDDDTGSVYGPERTVEVAVLCDPDVRAAIADAGVRLVSFGDVAPGRGASPTRGDAGVPLRRTSRPRR